MAKIGKKAQEQQAIQQYGISTASSINRFFAYAFDWIVGGIFSGLPAVFMYGIITGRNDMFSDLYVFEASGYGKWCGLLAGVLCIVFALLYYVVIPLKKYPGQTLGKKVLKIKIQTWENTNPDLVVLLKRYSVIFFIESSMFIISRYIMQMITLLMRFYVESVWTFVGLGFTVISIVLVIYTKKHDAIHDLIARTKVVEVQHEQNNL